MAAIRLLLGEKILPATVATNTKIADTLVFAQFKCDQSMDIFLLQSLEEVQGLCWSDSNVRFGS
jgi:hypothetical protein